MAIQFDLFPDLRLMQMEAEEKRKRARFIRDEVLPALRSLDMPHSTRAYEMLKWKLEQEADELNRRIEKHGRD